MCQLYALLANEPTKVECSLIRAQNALMEQSRNGAQGRQHADGWGVVCYDELDRSPIPTIVKHSNLAFNSDHFDHAAENVYSKAVVAHVRLATVGFASTLNAHPFIYDEWTFAHHGTIPCFDAISRKLEANTAERFMNCRLGTTDSELLFLWLLCQLQEKGITSENVGERQETARAILVDAIASLGSDCAEVVPDESSLRLNFVLTDGHVLFACRWNNDLYSAVRDGVYDCDVCGIPHIHHQDAADHRAIAVANKPLTKESWQEIPNHSLLYVDRNLSLVTDKIPHDKLVGS